MGVVFSRKALLISVFARWRYANIYRKKDYKYDY